MRNDGSLVLRAGLDARSRERAKWNVALLRLDLHDDERMRLLERLHAVEALRDDENPSASVVKVLNILEHDLAKRLPMFEAYGIPMSSQLRERLAAIASERRRAATRR